MEKDTFKIHNDKSRNEIIINEVIIYILRQNKFHIVTVHDTSQQYFW